MILHDKTDLKLLISEINSQLSRSDIRIKRARLYEIFSKSQGFKTKAALVSRLPIYLDASKNASNDLLESIKWFGSKSGRFIYPNSSLLESAACIAQPFPVVAPPNDVLKLSIDWEDGFIYRPYFCKQNEYSGTMGEIYGHSSSFTLSSIVLEGEYRRLIEWIKPFVQQVVDGYTDYGPEEMPTFTEAACIAFEKITQIIDDFEFEFSSGLDSYDPSDIFGEDIVNSSDVEERGITEVVLDDALLLDHSYTDVDLRCIVAKESERALGPINNECLYHFIRSLSNACKGNYDANSRTVAIAQ